MQGLQQLIFDAAGPGGEMLPQLAATRALLHPGLDRFVSFLRLLADVV
jgi:hypothetical protein